MPPWGVAQGPQEVDEFERLMDCPHHELWILTMGYHGLSCPCFLLVANPVSVGSLAADETSGQGQFDRESLQREWFGVEGQEHLLP